MSIDSFSVKINLACCMKNPRMHWCLFTAFPYPLHLKLFSLFHNVYENHDILYILQKFLTLYCTISMLLYIYCSNAISNSLQNTAHFYAPDVLSFGRTRLFSAQQVLKAKIVVPVSLFTARPLHLLVSDFRPSRHRCFVLPSYRKFAKDNCGSLCYVPSYTTG